MKKLHKGSTLIELMITVAIIGILASVAVTSYQNYLIKVRISEGFELAAPAKLAIAFTYQSQATVPDQASTGFNTPLPTTNVDSIIVANDGSAEITITYTALAKNVVIKWIPQLHPDKMITWTCKVQNADHNKYVPYYCRM